MTALQLYRLRVGFNGRLEGAQTLMVTVRIVVATVIIAAIARGLWALLDQLLGRSLPAELIAVGFAVAVAGALYAKLVLAMRIPEARQIEQLIVGRLRGRAA
jgi:putative peptidoglycan lipid II flippase